MEGLLLPLFHHQHCPGGKGPPLGPKGRIKEGQGWKFMWQVRGRAINRVSSGGLVTSVGEHVVKSICEVLMGLGMLVPPADTADAGESDPGPACKKLRD